jgi:hypothetical protein
MSVLDDFAEALDEEEGAPEEVPEEGNVFHCLLECEKSEAMKLEQKSRGDAAGIERLNAALAEPEGRFLERGLNTGSCFAIGMPEDAWTLRRWGKLSGSKSRRAR